MLTEYFQPEPLVFPGVTVVGPSSSMADDFATRARALYKTLRSLYVPLPAPYAASPSLGVTLTIVGVLEVADIIIVIVPEVSAEIVRELSQILSKRASSRLRTCFSLRSISRSHLSRPTVSRSNSAEATAASSRLTSSRAASRSA